ncbi:MAG: hypothetical protein J6K32_02530 [Clostridia bacterium]|nr:hypothetical protein [Clostridia bacterium]
MTLNTSKTLERTSTVLGRRCEETQKNMTRLMAEAGCAGAPMATVMLPQIPGSRDDVIFAGLNGAKFYFLRGQKARMPLPVKQILVAAGVIE